MMSEAQRIDNYLQSYQNVIKTNINWLPKMCDEIDDRCERSVLSFELVKFKLAPKRILNAFFWVDSSFHMLCIAIIRLSKDNRII